MGPHGLFSVATGAPSAADADRDVFTGASGQDDMSSPASDLGLSPVFHLIGPRRLHGAAAAETSSTSSGRDVVLAGAAQGGTARPSSDTDFGGAEEGAESSSWKETGLGFSPVFRLIGPRGLHGAAATETCSTSSGGHVVLAGAARGGTALPSSDTPSRAKHRHHGLKQACRLSFV